MKTINSFLSRGLRGALLALAVSGSGMAMAQSASFDAECAPRLSGVQQRLFDKSDQGPDALRDFMFVRRGILQLDIYETGVWADSIRQERAACIKQLARMPARPGTGTRMANAGASAPAR
jgi:hypothetical protein